MKTDALACGPCAWRTSAGAGERSVRGKCGAEKCCVGHIGRSGCVVGALDPHNLRNPPPNAQSWERKQGHKHNEPQKSTVPQFHSAFVSHGTGTLHQMERTATGLTSLTSFSFFLLPLAFSGVLPLELSPAAYHARSSPVKPMPCMPPDGQPI